MTDADETRSATPEGAGAPSEPPHSRVAHEAATTPAPDSPEDPSVFSARIAAGVATTALMTAVDVFLFGAVIAQKDATPHAYSAALILILVSGLGFLYGTLIYANSHERLRSKARFGKQMACANVVSETLGVFPLVLAIPLVVVAVTSGAGLAWITFGISAFAFAAYESSSYSLLRLYITRPGALLLLVTLLALDFVCFSTVRSRTSTEARIATAGGLVALLLLAAAIGILRIASGKAPRPDSTDSAGDPYASSAKTTPSAALPTFCVRTRPYSGQSSLSPAVSGPASISRLRVIGSYSPSGRRPSHSTWRSRGSTISSSSTPRSASNGIF